MGYLVPSPTSTLKEIFQEKIHWHSTDKFLVSAELIGSGYLKWLIYVAAFKDRTGLNHEEFYSKEVAFMKHPNNLNQQWRGHLFKELEAGPGTPSSSQPRNALASPQARPPMGLASMRSH